MGWLPNVEGMICFKKLSDDSPCMEVALPFLLLLWLHSLLSRRVLKVQQELHM